jgi:polar amino acid transport system permease protein
MSSLAAYAPQLAIGFALTLELALVSAFCGMVLGIAGAAAKLSPIRWLSRTATAAANLVRGIPEFLIVLVVYFGLPRLLRSVAGAEIDVGPFATGAFALAIVFGAYASEAFRGAFLAVPKGAAALGMTPAQAFVRVRLPQAWRVVLPSLNNQWQSLLKDTALVSVIGLEELMRKTQIAAQVTKQPFTFYLAAASVYLVMLGLSNPLFGWLERRARRGLAPLR